MWQSYAGQYGTRQSIYKNNKYQQGYSRNFTMLRLKGGTKNRDYICTHNFILEKH